MAKVIPCVHCGQRLGCEYESGDRVDCYDCQEKNCPGGILQCICGGPRDLPRENLVHFK
jgi:hypothetical protein